MTVLAARLVDGDRVLDLHPSLAWGLKLLDLGAPDVRDVVDDRSSADGTLDETAFHGARLVTLGGRVVDDGDRTAAEALDDLGYYAHPGRRPWLVYRLEGQSTRRVRLRADQRSSPLTADQRKRLDWQASWRAPSGLLQSDVLHVLSANPAEGEEGRSYDLTFDRSYPASLGLGTVEAVNAGNADADPVVRIFGPCTGPRVANDTTGLRLEFTAEGGLSVADGDYVEVDLAQRTARLNGDPAQSRLRYLEYADPARSSWWTLTPGDNLVRFYPLTSSAPAQAEISWRDAWI